MNVIELGDFTSGSEQRAATPREFDRRIIRRAVLAAVAALTILAVTGSARPEPRLVRVLWSIPFAPEDSFAASPDTVYVSPAGRGDLVAYDIADGSVRWSIRMPDPAGWPNVGATAGVLLLPAGAQSTMAVDAGTGRELWQRPGSAYAITNDLALMVDWDDNMDTIRGFRAVRLRDGGVVWERSGVSVNRMVTGGADQIRPDVAITIQAGGAAEVIRIADGARLASGRLAWEELRPGSSDVVDVFADREHVYVRIAEAQRASLTAYALGSLLQTWRVDDAAVVAAYPCGAVVCTLEGHGYAAYDPATGFTRWRAAGVNHVWSVAPGLLLADEGADDVYALIDDWTGRRIAGLGIGVPLENHRSAAVHLLRNTRSPANRTAISVFDLNTRKATLLGMIGRVGDRGCEDAGPRLVCPMVAGRLDVVGVDPGVVTAGLDGVTGGLHGVTGG